MKLIVSVLALLVHIKFAMAFDLGAFGDAAKKLADIKKSKITKKSKQKKIKNSKS